MNLRQISNQLATWAAVLTAIATAYAFIHTYRESVAKQVDDRRRQSFELLRQFSSRDFVPLREKAVRVVRLAESCEPAPLAKAQLSETEGFAFVEFFDMVSACQEAELCDGSLVRQFFVPHANGLWPAFRDWIEQVRANEAKLFKAEKPFGAGLERLGSEMRSHRPCKQGR